MFDTRSRVLRRLTTRTRTIAIGLTVAAFTVAGSGTAQADVLHIPDSIATKTTVNGTQLEIKQEGQWVNTVIPLNGNPFARDVFFGGNTHVQSAGGAPITGGNLDVGIEVGYQVDVSNGLTLGGRQGSTPQISLGIPAPLGTTIPLLPNSAGPLTFTLSAPGEVNVAVPIRPGQIVSIPLNKKTLTTPSGNINLENIHFQVNGAAGAISLRTYSQWTASTKDSDDVFAVYSEPVIF